jgi:hypothetical protein
MRLCPVCNGAAEATIGELTNTKVAPLARTSYDLVQCKGCDVVYLSPLPSESDLKILYVDELQFDYHTEEQSQAVVDFMKSRLEEVLRRIALKSPPRVLEIGAGPAWMARAAKKMSSDAKTVAQDVTSEVAANCPWVDRYIVGSIDDAEIDSLGPYDVISMTHVIEHLTDPVAALRRLRPVTRGRVFITAPHRPVKWDGSIESWRSYSYNHVPAHLQYFSQDGLRRAAEASGFTLDYWDANSEEGQAFEAWLRPKT